ncbi:unnamed protein product [Leptosia nina]|uniref:Speckle targeted PIP5K1A-regulated poly(A) polymerase n=1 Tax=Leptosia nina TaxID=320188 RepID=A0AAV1J367_9NEOP
MTIERNSQTLDIVQISKSLSWILRHGVQREGLEISDEGYVSLSTLLRHKKFRKYNFNDIKRVVDSNDKQRFKLRLNPSTSLWEIKANQGHSIKSVKNSELIPIIQDKYPLVIHGTYLRNWDNIKIQGLSHMSRNHIHFAKGLPNDPNIKSGIRRDAQVLIYINLKKALQGGIKFFESENGVILTEGDANGFLKPEYFLRAVKFENNIIVPHPNTTSKVRQDGPSKQINSSSADLKINVSGFPPYTRIDDLKNTFSSYGQVNVKIYKRQAVITFANKDDVEHALSQSNKLTLYGSFLTLKPHSTAPAHEKAKPHFARSKHEHKILEPQKIDLSGDVYKQLDNILDVIRLTQQEVINISMLYLDLETALQTYWPGCRAVPFGSITTGLGIKGSDADCFVEIPNAIGSPDFTYVFKAKRILQQYPDIFTDILTIPNANTPIVKFFHTPTGTNCDLSFKTLLGTRNSQLIAFLLHADPRLIPTAVLIKYWAKVHDLSGTGKMSNYALTMLFIFYLQQVSILPSVEWLQKNSSEWIVDHWNTGFLNEHSLLPKTENSMTIAEILGGFFKYYSDFNFDTLTICPLTGSTIPKKLFQDVESLPDLLNRYKENVKNDIVKPMNLKTAVCIQDPFELCHNVGCMIGNKLSKDIKAYLKFAAAAFKDEESPQDFLRTILLKAPPVPSKENMLYRSTIYSKELNEIVDEEWKNIVQSVISLIFEDICHAKLEKVVSDATQPTKKGGDKKAPIKKDEERYFFTLTKAVWKRKRFTKLYAHMRGTFLEKQIKITHEIINIDKEMHNLRIQLAIIPTKIKSVSVNIKYIDGNMTDFQEFGKMFNSMFKQWFLILMRPYLPKNNTNVAKDDSQEHNIINKDSKKTHLGNSENDLLLAVQNCSLSEGPD